MDPGLVDSVDDAKFAEPVHMHELHEGEAIDLVEPQRARVAPEPQILEKFNGTLLGPVPTCNDSPYRSRFACNSVAHSARLQLRG